MSATVFVLDVILTLILSGFLLFKYGDWFRQKIFVTLSVLIAWYFSFLIIFVIPLDVSMTKYGHCLRRHNISLNGNETEIVCQPPYSVLPTNILPNLWRIVYWTSQFLTWIVLPLMRSFTQAGEFGFVGKFKSALWDNAIYYASYLFIALVILLYIMTQPGLHLDWERCKAIASSASNTWGLLVLVLMLGYGLIEVPRSLWNASLRGYTLNRAYFQLAKLMSEKSDAEEELEDALSMVYSADTILGTTHTEPLRVMVDIIVQKIPTDLYQNHRIRSNADYFDGNNNEVTEKTLTNLHRRVIKAIQTHHRTETQWRDLTDSILKLEDINKNMISNEHLFRHRLGRAQRNALYNFVYNPTVEWYWQCMIRPLSLKLGAILAGIMSVMIIWSEVTFFSERPTLSLFAIFVEITSDGGSYFALELGVFITILYLCASSFYTVFKIRVLNYYYLASNHQSDEYTLLFSGALVCRLTPPLVLNFLSLIHMDSHVIGNPEDETSYTKVMGHMDLISIISDYFNIYFPILLIAFSSATYFSLGARCLTAIGFQQFLTADSELTLEMVEEGKEHISREKRIRSRKEESDRRRHRNRRQAEQTRSQGEDVEEGNFYSAVSQDNSTNFISSPERSLLNGVQQPSSPSLQFGRSRSSPPRNIFDDL